MSADTDAAAIFEAERARLVGLAYRLLGSLADAEDVVQDAWLRWERSDHAAIERPSAWLTTVVGRLGLDRLRARRRDRADYVGPWLPEPLVEPVAETDPAHVAEISDSLTTAFLVLLERLGPEERLAVLLADVFGEPFRAVAATLGRSETSTRQLTVRARRKLRAHYDDRRPAAPAEQLEIAGRFLGALLAGDMAEARALLAPDVVSLTDGGRDHHSARRPVVGADRVSRFFVNITKRLTSERTSFEPAWVNGRVGVVVRHGSRPLLVIEVDVVDGAIVRLYVVRNPAKLVALDHRVTLT
jgi:RNA polymerase sigma-70 factor (ECF subfamily)